MSIRRTIAVLTLIPGGLLAAGPARPDIYTWVDDQGVVHFQDDAPKNQSAKKMELPTEERISVEPPPPAPPPARHEAEHPSPAESARPKRAAPKVEVYSTSWCPWCKKARAFFASRGIAYTDYDIEKDAGALKRKLEMDGNQHVPTVVVDGKVIRGYAPSEYQAALGAP